MKALQNWLSYLETAHSSGLIDMGSERVEEVKKCMNLMPQCPVAVVTGTSGRGSVCTYLSHIYKKAGLKVSTLTSPHLLHYNERTVINTQPVSNGLIIFSSECIGAAHGEVSLTCFEFNALAAVDVFIRENVDVMILEVGLGRRLDIMNVSDGDRSIVTSVDLGHQAFLGDAVEQAGFEKAGMFRSGKPAVRGQNPAPELLVKHTEEIDAKLLMVQRDLDFASMESVQWNYRFHPQFSDGQSRNHSSLPFPVLHGAYQLSNVACALTVLECLSNQLPVDIGAIKRGLLLVGNPGRFRVLPGHPLVVLNVSHSPHAVRALRHSLINLVFAQKWIAVFSILSDKNIDGVLGIVRDQFDEWNTASLNVLHDMMVEALQTKLTEHGIDNVSVSETVAAAYHAALTKATENDRIVISGSFHAAADIMVVLREH